MTIIKDEKDYKKYLKMFYDRKTIKILGEKFVIEEFNIINGKLYLKLHQVIAPVRDYSVSDWLNEFYGR